MGIEEIMGIFITINLLSPLSLLSLKSPFLHIFVNNKCN